MFASIGYICISRGFCSSGFLARLAWLSYVLKFYSMLAIYKKTLLTKKKPKYNKLKIVSSFLKSLRKDQVHFLLSKIHENVMN